MKSLDTIEQELADLYEKCKKDGGWYNYDDVRGNAEEQVKHSTPYRLIDYLQGLFDDESTASRATGLLTAFAARRSLAWWFGACVDVRPRNIVNGLIKFWLAPGADISVLDESWSVEIVPTNPHGDKCEQCGYSDPWCASRAVAHAARFAFEKNMIDAMQVLCDMYSCENATWLFNVAASCTAEMREMSVEEQFAYGDFDWLAPTGHTLGSILLGEVNPEEVAERMIRYGIPF